MTRPGECQTCGREVEPGTCGPCSESCAALLDLPRYRCECCGRATPHDGRTCTDCGCDCCDPHEGLCPHCAENAALDARERAEDAGLDDARERGEV